MSDADTILIDFLKEQENAPLNAGHRAYLRHESPEGGLDTIGFGHKLTKEEVESGKVYGVPLSQLDMASAEHILRIDIKKKKDTLRRSLKKKFGVELNSLSPRKQAMLLDYEYNLGSAVKKFPTFTGAVLSGDDAVQKDEYIRSFKDGRTGQRRPLARNAAFYNTFMSRDAKDRWGE